MASTFLPDIIFLFEGANLGLSYGSNVFKGAKAKIPKGSGPFVSLIRTGGSGTEGTHNSVDVPAYERLSGQVLVRASDYEVAEALADQLHDLMWAVMNQLINGTYWRQLNVRDVFELPLDDQERPRLAFNFDCVKRTSPATS